MHLTFYMNHYQGKEMSWIISELQLFSILIQKQPITVSSHKQWLTMVKMRQHVNNLGKPRFYDIFQIQDLTSDLSGLTGKPSFEDDLI